MDRTFGSRTNGCRTSCPPRRPTLSSWIMRLLNLEHAEKDNIQAPYVYNNCKEASKISGRSTSKPTNTTIYDAVEETAQYTVYC